MSLKNNEEMLARIWTQVLNVEKVDLHDNFFELGGHSLVVMELITRVRETFQVELPLLSIFEAPTVASLAAVIAENKTKQTQSGYSPPSLPTIVPDLTQRHLPFPLTDMQQAYWLGQGNFFELGNVGAYVYIEYEFAQLDVERCNLAWQQLIERHDMLRAIVLPDGQQQILKQVPPYKIEVLDLREQEPQSAAFQLEAVRQRMSNQVLKTNRWPLFELRASHLADNYVRLHMSFHLLLYDGLSLELIKQEWAYFYQNPEAPLSPLELSFRDYVLAEVTFRDSELYQRSLSYWQRRLRILPPAPELPLAKNPASLPHHRLVRLRGRLEPETWLRLKMRTIKAGLSPTIVLCTAYAEVLATWSKASRFTINVLVFNRLSLHPQVNDIVGNFSSTNLLEVDHSTQDSFENRAKRLRQQLWDDLEHNYVSGVRVLQELNRTQGSTSGATMPVVFTSILNLFPEDSDNSENAWQGKEVYSCLQTPQVWLDHQVSEEAGSLYFNWDAVDEIFPEGLIQDMFDAYCCFLHRLADDERTWQETSRQQLVPFIQLEQRAAVNATEIPVPEGTLPTLFATQVSQRVHQAAVVSSRQTLTYRELYRRSNQIGHWLRQLEARPNTLVAVVMEKGWEQVVAVLGVLQSGAAYLPVDPELPKERFWYILRHSEVTLALTQPWLEENLEWPETVQRLCLDNEDLGSLDDRPLDPVQDPENLAYVIFTSGSTGLPKGVMIDHRSAVNTIVDINRRFSVGSEDRVLALSSLSFDLSIYDIFGTLAAGGTIIIPDASSTQDPAHWIELMSQEQVTVWNSAPALMEMLVEYIAGRAEALSFSLRLILLSGDWIPVNLPDRIKALVENVQVVSLGGATEASIWSVFYPIGTVKPDWKSIPYGYPLANQSLYVLNEMLELCPVWVSGQLYIGGSGLAKGYWRDKEKTSASFITHPRTGERLYRTGDLGRYLPDGSLEFLGREDFQVKIRGHRIELGEIEVALVQHAAVHAAVVTALGELRGNKSLVAYVVLKQDNVLTASELQSLLRDKLPAYMVPSTFVILDYLPLTSNGKVDRRALPIPDGDRLETQIPFIAPRDSLELQLAQIWEDVLGIHSIGVMDNFFNLGGQSFSAVRMISQIQKQFGRELSLSTFLQEATIERLAEILRQHNISKPQSPLVRIQPGDSKRPFFCVHPSGGNVLCYIDLASHLGFEQPFYGLQALGLDGEQQPYTRVEDMATHYVKALRVVQPEGLYLLGGWSSGGVIAFEMAHQLQKQNCKVALLALLDSPAPGSVPNLDDATLAAWFLKDLGGRFEEDLPVLYAELQQLGPEEQLNYVLEQARAINVVPPDAGLLQIHRLLQVFKGNMRALQSYTQQDSTNRIILFRANEVPSKEFSEVFSKDFHDPTLGWGKFTSAIEVHTVPGNHYTMLAKPHVQALAERLGTYISEAQTV